MGWLSKVLATKPHHLSSIPEVHTVGGENGLLSSDFHRSAMARSSLLTPLNEWMLQTREPELNTQATTKNPVEERENIETNA